MKTFLILLLAFFGLASCKKSTNTSESSISNSITDSIKQEVTTINSSIYEQTDSVFNINGKLFRVTAKLFDVTEIATNKGDTLSRPTFSCLVKIFDAGNKVVLADSLLRDSWGYSGKIKPIDTYQITSPLLAIEGDEIVLSFNIFNYEENDAINGRIAFNVNNLKSRYFWVESSISE